MGACCGIQSGNFVLKNGIKCWYLNLILPNRMASCIFSGSLVPRVSGRKNKTDKIVYYDVG